MGTELDRCVVCLYTYESILFADYICPRCQKYHKVNEIEILVKLLRLGYIES